MALNPFRYRGYYYDNETGLYYLNSRYYDPETGRFLNADGFVSTGQGLSGFNMFAYCGDNPIVRVDTFGSMHKYFALEDGMGKWFGLYRTEKGLGKVYIVKPGEKESAVRNAKENDVVVLDVLYDKKDPNLQILDSWRVKSPQERSEILDLLLEYNEHVPGKPWKRSKANLKLEWTIHNIAYETFDSLQRRTADADLNNNDNLIYQVLVWLSSRNYIH